MGKLSPESLNPPDDMEVISFFRFKEPAGKLTTYKAVPLSGNLSIEDIRGMLSKMLSNPNPNRVIAFIPRDSQTEYAEQMSPATLEQLGHLPEADRQRQIDIDSRRIKGSLVAVLIERISS